MRNGRITGIVTASDSVEIPVSIVAQLAWKGLHAIYRHGSTCRNGFKLRTNANRSHKTPFYGGHASSLSVVLQVSLPFARCRRIRSIFEGFVSAEIKQQHARSFPDAFAGTFNYVRAPAEFSFARLFLFPSFLSPFLLCSSRSVPPPFSSLFVKPFRPDPEQKRSSRETLEHFSIRFVTRLSFIRVARLREGANVIRYAARCFRERIRTISNCFGRFFLRGIPVTEK